MANERKELREIDKPFYRYWQALYHSFFNGRLYVDVGKRWQGYGLLYLLLVMFVVIIPFSIRVIINFNQFFQEELIKPLMELPTIYIQNGQASLDKPMPYIIKNNKNQAVIIVDTTGTVDSINAAYPHLNILITKDKMYYRTPSPQFFFETTKTSQLATPIQVYPFSGQANAIFVGKDWVQSAGIMHLKLFFSALIYPTLALIFFAVFLCLFLAFALMGQFIARLFRITISYKQAARLVMVSATPFMAVMWFSFALGNLEGRFRFLLPLIFIIYYCCAIIALKRESKKVVVK